MRTLYIVTLKQNKQFYASHVMWLLHAVRVWGRWKNPGRGRCYEFSLSWVKSVEYVGGSVRQTRPRTRKKDFLGMTANRVRKKRRLDTHVRWRHNLFRSGK